MMAHFSGNLNVESGGSQKTLLTSAQKVMLILSIGETSYVSFIATIETKATGTGGARSLYLRAAGIHRVYVGGSLVFNHTSLVSEIYTSLKPAGDGASILAGRMAIVGANVASVDGSFSGNLVSEVGGSYKIYNLGTEGDADTEYLEISHDGTRFKIDARSTGTGTNQEVGIGRAGSMSMIHNGSGGTKTRSLVPQINDTYVLGSTNLRYANVVSVDGDFSGTVIARELSDLEGRDRISFSSGIDQIVVRVGSNLCTIYNSTSCNELLRLFARPYCCPVAWTKSGYEWSQIWGVDGNFSGTVTTDSIDYDSSLIISNNGTERLELAPSRIRPSVNFFPKTDNFIVCGQEGSRWKSMASVDGSIQRQSSFRGRRLLQAIQPRN